MSEARSDDAVVPESQSESGDPADLSAAGQEFDDELHDAEAEADDEFRQ